MHRDTRLLQGRVAYREGDPGACAPRESDSVTSTQIRIIPSYPTVIRAGCAVAARGDPSTSLLVKLEPDTCSRTGFGQRDLPYGQGLHVQEFQVHNVYATLQTSVS